MLLYIGGDITSRFPDEMLEVFHGSEECPPSSDDVIGDDEANEPFSSVRRLELLQNREQNYKSSCRDSRVVVLHVLTLRLSSRRQSSSFVGDSPVALAHSNVDFGSFVHSGEK